MGIGESYEGYVVDAMCTMDEDANLLRDGSMDYKGRIARRDKTGGWRTAPLLFGPETGEKTAVLAVAANIVPYLTHKLHLPSSYAANLITTYQGTIYLLTLLGGFLADAVLGRFWVIVGGASILLLGLCLMTLSAFLPAFAPKPCENDLGIGCPGQYGMPLIIIYVALYTIGVGTAGVKSCASAFGADQFDPCHPEEKKGLAGFFSWYFFGMSCGGLFGATVLVWIEDNKGRRWGYLIPTLMLMAVMVAFLAGRTLYRYKAPKGSPLTQIAQVLVAAYKKRKLQLPSEPEMLFELDPKDQPLDYTRLKHSSQFKFLDKAAIVVDSPSELGGRSFWLLNSVTRVEETKMVIRLIPILVTTALFYTLFAQMTTYSVDQGTRMRRTITKSFSIPPASMAAFLQISILLSLYTWETFVVPITRRFTGNPNGTTSLQRIGVGLVLSILTMLVAAPVEKERLDHVKSEQRASGHVDMSIFWLLPQFMFAGAGEAITYAAQLDFFYNETPKAMRSMGSALCLCTLSAGYYGSTLLVSIVNSLTSHGSDGSDGEWLPQDINTGRLDKFYWLLAVAGTANFLLFLVCARWYKYKDFADEGLDSNTIDDTTSAVGLIGMDLNGKADTTSNGDSGLLAISNQQAANDDHDRRLEIPSHHVQKRSSNEQARDSPPFVRQRSKTGGDSPEADYHMTMRYSP